MEDEYIFLTEKDETAVRMHQKALEEMTAERNRRLDDLDIEIKNDVSSKVYRCIYIPICIHIYAYILCICIH
jgi:hypothetical protein